MENLIVTTPERTVMEHVDQPVEPPPADESVPACTFQVKNLSIWYGEKRAIDNVTLDIASNAVTALIGPSGCGKSTFIRTLNRMHELVPRARVEGRIQIDGEDIYGPAVDPVAVRRTIGMVFQRPNPSPAMSIFDNVAAGLRLEGGRRRKS